MPDLYLNLLGVNLTVAGIAFASLLALQQAAANVAGEEAAARVWKAAGVRFSLVWMSINALLSLAAAFALNIDQASLPRWDPGIDRLLSEWPLGAAIPVSTALAITFAVRAFWSASRFASSTRAVRELLKDWQLDDVLAAPVRPSIEAVREAAVRALHHPRPFDFDLIVELACLKFGDLLQSETNDARQARAMAAFRERFLMPLAEEGLAVDRPDQAATIGRASVAILDHVPKAATGLRTQTLEVSEQILDLLLSRPSARRAITDVVEQIYHLAEIAAGARVADAFQDACWALLPIAETDPSTFLGRNGVVSVGNGDEPNRPLERLVRRLGNLADAVWGRGAVPLSNPRSWLDAAGAEAKGLTDWISKSGVQREVENLLVNLLASMTRIGINEAAAGRGESAWLTYDVPVDIAILADRSVDFDQTTRAVTRQLAHIGLSAEIAGATVSGSLLADDVAKAIGRLPVSEATWLKTEIPMAGEFIPYRAVHAAFLGRLP